MGCGGSKQVSDQVDSKSPPKEIAIELVQEEIEPIETSEETEDTEPILLSDHNFWEITTVNYAIKGTDTLEMDVYRHDQMNPSLPVLFFVHGGGFYTGTRKENNIESFCKDFAERGYIVCNIDYRLYLKGQSFHCNQPSPEKINAFRTAVSDLRSATKWLLESDLPFDKNRVFVSGSSAGAEAVLHAPYWEANTLNLDEPNLFSDFRYAGLCAFAGAMVDTTLITPENTIPMLLFHGTCDPLVPYGTAIHHFCPEESAGGLLLHGSGSIADRLETLGTSYHLYTACAGKHSWASKPITEYREEIAFFLTAVSENQSFQDRTTFEGSLDKCKYGKDWGECQKTGTMR